MSLMKQKRHTSKRITDSARGQECLLMFEICASRDTVVSCHVNVPGLGGMGTKVSDLFTVPGCEVCHAILDGRRKTTLERSEVERIALQAMCHHQQYMLDTGLVQFKYK